MLKKRLKNVANLIKEDSIIDIGTDHGYLIVHLCQSDIITNALAVEITNGPLTNVKENIKKNNLSEKVKFALSDGLVNIDGSEVAKYEAITICGMGGSLISKIITQSYDKLQTKTLYLQPNNNEDKLRKTLQSLNFSIKYEELVKDNDIYYEIIKAVPGKMNLSEEEIYFGPHNIITKSNIFYEKHCSQLFHLKKINEQLIKNNVHNETLENELNLLRKVIDETL